MKNKLAPPFKTVVFPIIFGEGISNLDIILDMAVEQEVVKKSGSWFAYQDTKLGQGTEKSKQFLRDNPEILEEIENKVREKASPVEETNLVDETEDNEQE